MGMLAGGNQPEYIVKRGPNIRRSEAVEDDSRKGRKTTYCIGGMIFLKKFDKNKSIRIYTKEDLMKL